MPLRIVLVRHGLSSFNVEHRIQGRDDLSSLTATGQSQACATGAALRDLTCAAAYCSPLRRAAETARLLLAEQGQDLVAEQAEGLLGLQPADIWAIKQGNGGVTVIDYPEGPAGRPVVAAMNLTSHLGGVLDRTAAGAL